MSRYYDELQLGFSERADWTLPNVLRRQAEKYGDKVFVQFEDTLQLTYSQIDTLSTRLAHGLLDQGIKREDRVMVFMSNSPDYMLLWFALTKIGAVMVPINTANRDSFITHSVNSAQARVMVTDLEHLEHVRKVAEGMPELTTVYIVGKQERSAEHAPGNFVLADFQTLMSDDTRPIVTDVTYRDPALILQTGGTTGPSKSILMPHGQCYFFAEQFASLMRIDSTDVLVSAYPFFHASGLIFGLYQILNRGATIVLYPRFSASEWLGRNRRHRATVAQFVGATMDFVYQQPPTPEDADNDLTRVFAAPVAWKIADEFKSRFGVDRIVESIGSSETSLPFMSPWDEQRPPGAGGRLVADWFDVRIADPETDEEVETGQPGELLIRPKVPWIMSLGYAGDPANTLRVTRNLWWHTGDAVREDADGWFYFLDRTNDALRVRGENVSSYEIEQAVLAYPAVKGCAAVAVPADFEGGEHEVKACVQLHEHAEFELGEFISFCEQTMPWFAVPRYVDILDSLPQNEHGKLRRAELRAAGVTPTTVDRMAAGVLLSKERNRRNRDQVG